MFNRITEMVLIGLVIAAGAIATVVVLTGVAFGQGIGTSPVESEAILAGARDLYRMVTAGDASGWVIASSGLMLSIAALRWMMATERWPFKSIGDRAEKALYGSDLRGMVSTLALSTLGAAATGVLSGEGAPTWGLVKTALLVGVVAAGGYSVLWKRLVLPLLAKVPGLGDKLPETPDEAKAG